MLTDQFEKAAAQGNANAQFNLGIMYANGFGVKQDYLKAKEWFEKAAAQGMPEAQTALLDINNIVKKVKQNNLNKTTLNKKDLINLLNLGNKYFNGDGVTQDYLKAKVYYEKAAAQGMPEAQGNLGIIYDNGFGVKQDYLKAKEWYEKAAAQGNVDAQFNLGNIYFYGDGVKQNYLKAKEWYEKVAAKGMPKAHYNLGIMYYNGFGVKQNYLKSKEWFIKACNGGFKPGCKIINKELKQLGY